VEVRHPQSDLRFNATCNAFVPGTIKRDHP
jgi:hypothetical protein